MEGKLVAEVVKDLLEAKEKGVATTAKSKAGKVSERYLEVLETGLTSVLPPG